MEALRILIISDSLTFSEGLKSLLRSEPQLKVIGQEMDVSRVINYLKQLKPDVIIWASTGLSQDALGHELRLLEATPRIRTVSINLRSNKIAIYQSGRKITHVVQSVEDLIEAVQGDLLYQDNFSLGGQVYDVPPRQPVDQPSLLSRTYPLTLIWF